MAEKQKLTLDAVAALYKDSDMPVMLVRTEKRMAVWQNRAMEERFPAIRETSDVGAVFGEGGDDVWRRAAAGEYADMLLTDMPPVKLIFLPVADGISLVHVQTGENDANITARMAQAVSSQIRTPLEEEFSLLAAVRDMADDDRLDEAVAGIGRCCYNILRVQNDISYFCRSLAGTEAYDMRVLDLAASVKQICGAVAFVAIGIRIPFDYDIPDTRALVRADPEKMETAILNILLNSFKYTKEGNCVKLEMLISESEARIIISDKGLGMPRDVLERAFEPFFAYTPGMDYPQSLGLGLSVARDFARRCGGDIRLLSIEGEGTVAMLILPLYEGGDEKVTVCESAVDMLSDRFSPLFAIMADVVTPPTGPARRKPRS